jgi:hypothetical protein
MSGRVVDEQTREPIKGVTVRRGRDTPPTMEPRKGAEMLAKNPSVHTGPDGAFVLSSERALGFWRSLGWYSVTLSFAHPNYETLTHSYSRADSTITPDGEPFIGAGDILLKRLEK